MMKPRTALRGVISQEARSTRLEHLPEEESQSHSLLTADLVHEQATYQTTRQIEAVDDSPVTDVLDETVRGVLVRQIRCQEPDNG